MNSENSQGYNSSAADGTSAATNSTASGSKRFFLTLLILASLAGLCTGAWMLSQSSQTIGLFLETGLPKKKPSLGNLSDLMGKAGLPTTLEISCQGTMVGTDGGSLAILNDEMVAVGAEVNGIHIIEITPVSVLIEYNGSEYVLNTGESLSVAK